MKKLILILFVVILVSCNSKEKEIAKPLTETIISEEKADEKVAVDFYKWYASDDNIQNFDVMKELKDSTDFYAIDFEKVEKYLDAFKKTGFVSDRYLNGQHNYFKECEEEFKKNPANDGPPYGLDYDLIMHSQDYDDDLANTDKIKVVEIYRKPTESKLKLLFFAGGKIDVTLSKTNEKWLIDKIENGYEE